MGTELFILKNDDDYIRVKETAYSVSRLDKASVFPLTELNAVTEHLEQMKQAGFLNPGIFKLILTEEPFYLEKSQDDTP